MLRNETNHDPHALALQALAWTLAEPARASRLLGVTGLDADALRARIGETILLAAVLAFLEAHEPDLIAAADAIGVSPREIVAAREALERG